MKIIEKLRKLIKHEESARAIGNLAEAEAFAEKIQELLDSYNLSFSEIDVETAQSTVNLSSNGLHALNNWQKVFITNLAEINGCHVVFSGTEIQLVGNENDREIVFDIYKYFEKLGREFAQLSLDEWKKTAEYKRKRKKIFHGKLYKKSFLHGFVIALVTRFRERHEAAKQACSNSTALLFIGNKLTEARHWIEKNLQVKQVSRKKVNYSKFKSDAFSKGVKAGDSVALTTQTIN